MAVARTIDRKLSRQRDQRRILIRTLATQLVETHAITTTAPRSKALKPYVEKLISKAVKGGLAQRRLVRSKLDTTSATNHLFDLIAPQMKRTSGFLTTSRAGSRKGDGTSLITLSFVDAIAEELPKTKTPVKSNKKADKLDKPTAKKAKT